MVKIFTRLQYEPIRHENFSHSKNFFTQKNFFHSKKNFLHKKFFWPGQLKVWLILFDQYLFCYQTLGGPGISRMEKNSQKKIPKQIAIKPLIGIGGLESPKNLKSIFFRIVTA